MFGPIPRRSIAMHSRTRKHQGSLRCRVVRRSTVVGHIPRKILSKELFAVKSLVHSVILKIFTQGGLEIPCK